MVISVLERRSEIGLRRALGATKGHIRIQFLSDAVLRAARMSPTEAPLDRMTSSEQTRHLISLLAGPWTLAVLAQLADGGRRYQNLDDALEGVSHKVLTETLPSIAGSRRSR